MGWLSVLVLATATEHSSCLNTNKRWRAGLKVAYHRVGWIGRLIGVEPEVIQRAEANGVSILILRKGFGVPGDRACVLGNSPWRAAITLAVKGAIICKGGMLRRRMKADVRDVYSWPNRHAERLDRAVEVLVIESVFIVPHTLYGVRYFETHEPDTIIAVIRFDLMYVAPLQAMIAGCSRTVAPAPVKLKGWLIPVTVYGRTKRCYTCCTGPDDFGTTCLRGGQCIRLRQDTSLLGLATCSVVNVDQNSVSGYVMAVAAVIVGC